MNQDIIMGHYEILEEVGRGAMGIVYKARDTKLERIVALKELLIDSNVSESERKQMVERFYREAKAAGKLSHPNIVTIYDYGDENGRYFIAMEFLTGQSLADILNQGMVYDIDHAVNLICMVGEALDCAHREGIVHRDIKPANIMITDDGRVKVADFGIARVTSSSTMTQAGTMIGSPGYMSPEQVAGVKVDGRSDIFSLGVILYQLVTGEKPFTGDTLTSIIYKITQQEPVPPRSINIQVSPYIEFIIKKTLQKDPTRRFQSANEMVAALRNPESISNKDISDAMTTIAVKNATYEIPQQSYAPTAATNNVKKSRMVVVLGSAAVLLFGVIITLALYFMKSAHNPSVNSVHSSPPNTIKDVPKTDKTKIDKKDEKTEPPIVSLIVDKDNGIAPLNVNFISSVQTSSPVTYEWNFGDNSHVADKPNLSHVFAKPGTYEVVLRVTDQNKNVVSKNMLINVKNSVPAVLNNAKDINKQQKLQEEARQKEQSKQQWIARQQKQARLQEQIKQQEEARKAKLQEQQARQQEQLQHEEQSRQEEEARQARQEKILRLQEQARQEEQARLQEEARQNQAQQQEQEQTKKVKVKDILKGIILKEVLK